MLNFGHSIQLVTDRSQHSCSSGILSHRALPSNVDAGVADWRVNTSAREQLGASKLHARKRLNGIDGALVIDRDANRNPVFTDVALRCRRGGTEWRDRWFILNPRVCSARDAADRGEILEEGNRRRPSI